MSTESDLSEEKCFSHRERGLTEAENGRNKRGDRGEEDCKDKKKIMEQNRPEIAGELVHRNAEMRMKSKTEKALKLIEVNREVVQTLHRGAEMMESLNDNVLQRTIKKLGKICSRISPRIHPMSSVLFSKICSEISEICSRIWSRIYSSEMFSRIYSGSEEIFSRICSCFYDLDTKIDF